MKVIKNGFTNERLGIELDVYVIEGREWFKAKDVSDYLGYLEAKDMTRIISFEDNINRHFMPNVVNPRGTTFINEFGLYEVLCKINKTDFERYNKAR
ncbi:MAG: BRO family protein, partial [Cetobacterium sp.]